MSVDPSEAMVVHCANCGGTIKSLAADSLCPYCGAHVHQLTQNEQVAKILGDALSEAIHQGQAAGGRGSAQAAPRVDPVAAYNSVKNTYAEVKKGFRIARNLFLLLVLALFAIVFYSHFH